MPYEKSAEISASFFAEGGGQRIKPNEIVDGVGKKSADQGIYNPGSAELLHFTIFKHHKKAV